MSIESPAELAALQRVVDASLSAHFEHTIAIAETAPLLLMAA